jgi:hypothetical protein
MTIFTSERRHFGLCHTGRSEATIRYLINKRFIETPDQVRGDKFSFARAFVGVGNTQ